MVHFGAGTRTHCGSVEKVVKLKYYLEESNEIIEQEDFIEIEVTHKQTTAIQDKLCNLIAHVQELKIEQGIETTRAIRQWKKDMKERYAPWTLQMGKIENAMSQRREEIQDEIDRKKAHEQRARDLSCQEELRDKEREMWEEKFHAELKMTEKKIEDNSVQRHRRGLVKVRKHVPYAS